VPPAKKARKRYGPFTVVGWAGIAGGTVAVYLIYKRYRAGQSSAAQAALSGGSTIPAGTATTSPAGTSLTSWAAWEEAAVAMMIGAKYSPTQALNDLQNWIQGGCVSSTGYNAIGQAIATLGVPPGLGTSLPTLVACPTNQQQPSPGGTGVAPTPTPTGGPVGPPPALPAALASAMKGNGESIAGVAWDSTIHDWLYLTNRGGVYTLTQTGAPTGPGAAYGAISYLGLPASATQVAQGQPQRTFSQILVDPAGGYTLVATDGATYHFGP
jgi:hypothetical protein